MGCSSCGGSRLHQLPVPNQVNRPIFSTSKSEVAKRVNLGAPVAASEDSSKKVRLRYFGGGVTKKVSGTGCSTCRSGAGGYVNTTTETITFVSEDAPGGLFRQVVTVGHDIYVTEKQAEYLLALTYKNKGGQTVHKFKKVEEDATNDNKSN